MIRLRRLLVPHDLSPLADDALAAAAEFAGPKGELLVLHAVVPIMPTTQTMAISLYVPVHEMIMDAKRHLARVVADRIGPNGPKTTIKVVVGDPHECIVDHAAGQDAIVMSTRGRTGLAHLVMGSVAEKTVRHSPIPVLTIPSKAHLAAGSRTVPRRRAA